MPLGSEKFLDPAAMRFALTLAGIEAPNVVSGCELGAGGLSSAIAAATHPDSAWRAAFEDAGRAVDVGAMAARAGLSLEVEGGIDEFCARGDLPEFDFIGVSGNWAELGPATQEAILGLLERRLRPGGVFCAAYLVEPGAGQDAAFRLIGRTLLRGATPTDPDFAARFATMLAEAEVGLASAPLLQTRHLDYQGLLATLKADPDPTAAWRKWFDPRSAPTTFTEMAERLGAAGLSFGVSAELSNHSREINYTPRQRVYLAGFADVTTREQMSDLISYTWGRADYWVKAPTFLSDETRVTALRDTRLTLARPAKDFEYRVKGMLGHISLRREVYEPLLNRLASAGEARVGDLAVDMDLDDAVEAATHLVATGIARATLGNTETGDGCARLNHELMAAAVAGAELAACASPVLEGGVGISPRILRLMAAHAEGATDADALARRCAEIEGVDLEAGDSDAMRIIRDADAFLADSREYARLGVL